MMTLAEMVAILSQRCGSRDDIESRIKAEVLFVQGTLLEGTGAFKPWFLQSDPTTLATTAGVSTVDYPADYLAELEDSMLWYQDASGSWHKLLKKSYDYILEKNREPGPPVFYAVGATSFFVHPVPDAVYTLRFRYYFKDDLLINDSDTNLWMTFAPDLMLAETGLILAKYHTRDDSRVAIFEQDALAARQRLFVLHEAKQNVNRVYSMGED